MANHLRGSGGLSAQGASSLAGHAPGCRCRHSNDVEGLDTNSTAGRSGSAPHHNNHQHHQQHPQPLHLYPTDGMEREAPAAQQQQRTANGGMRVVKRLPHTKENAETLLIETSDGELIDIEKAVATRMSLAIRKKLESVGPNGVIQLDNITARALTKVMEYCHMHTAPHIVTMEKGMDLKTWDDKFVKLDPGTLCELASAAYHLQIKPLVDLTCQAIAQLLKGKTPAEIRRTFNILYDFQPEDDAPPPTMRDKLRNKLCNPKRKEQKSKSSSTPPEPVEDTRSVDDLLSFINDGKGNAATNTGNSKSKTKSSKKARQRERKKKDKLRTSQERERDLLRTSQEKQPNGLRTSQETQPTKGGSLKTSQEKNKASPRSAAEKSGKEERTTREKRERREDIIQKIINMQRTSETDNEGEQYLRSNSTSPSRSLSSTSSSPLSSSASSASTSPSSSPLSSPSHSRNPSANAPDVFFHHNDDTSYLAKSSRRDSTKAKPYRPESAYLPPNQPNQRTVSLRNATADLGKDLLLEISPDDDIWQEEDDDMDPELKAQQDREVEEFRRRLEQINSTTVQRPRIPLPSTLSLALSLTVDSLKG